MSRRALICVTVLGLALAGFAVGCGGPGDPALRTLAPGETEIPDPGDLEDSSPAPSPAAGAATAAASSPDDVALSVESPEPSSTAEPATATPEPTPDFSGAEVVVFTNANDWPIRDGATKPATFTLDALTRITFVQTYHWHGGKGVPPGTISITGPDGTVHGPWEAVGSVGQGGVKNAYWNAEPGVDLPPGTYTVTDSDPATHGTNDQMGGIGQTIVRGVAALP